MWKLGALNDCTHPRLRFYRLVNTRLICGIVTILCMFARHASAKDLTPEQFLELYEAAQLRIQSLSSSFQRSESKVRDGKKDERPMYIANITEHVQGDQGIVVTEWTENRGNRQSWYKTVYACDGKYQSRYTERPGTPLPLTGTVERMGQPGEENIYMSPGGNLFHAIYDPFNGYRSVTRKNLTGPEDSRVELDEATGLYRFVARVAPEKGLTWVVVVDPSKGFMPVAHAWCLPPTGKRWDNTKDVAIPLGAGLSLDANDPAQRLLKLEGLSVLRMSRNTEAEQYGEVWLPTHIENHFTEFSQTVAATDIQVNTPIADSVFNIRFPNGTRVDNRVVNIEYVVRRLEGKWLIVAVILGGIVVGWVVLAKLQKRNWQKHQAP